MNQQRVLILSARRDYVQAMRQALLEIGGAEGRIEVEMDALRAMQLAPRQYDLIVLDAVMEAMDGLQLLVLLKLQAPDIPYVVVSDQAGDEARDQALQNGADFYLLRPGTAAAFQNGARNMVTMVEKARVARQIAEAEEPIRQLTEILSERCQAGESVILHVKSHFQEGDIFLHQGEIFHAQYPGKSGLAAFQDLCRWDGGMVRIQTFRLTNIPPRTIDLPRQRLLEMSAPEVPVPSGLPLAGDLGHQAEVVLEAPPRNQESTGLSPFPIDPLPPGATEMPEVRSYWKVNLMGDLVEGTRVADAERSALITTFFYRKMADVAVALEVDYFDSLVLAGPKVRQVLVADHFGVRHALLDADPAGEKVGQQFVEWCGEQGL